MTTSAGGVVKAQPWSDPSARPYVEVERITKSFGDFTAVKDVSLKIYKGEMFALVGASGCGKTTLLRMLAGFVAPSSGRIVIDGVDMSSVPPPMKTPPPPAPPPRPMLPLIVVSIIVMTPAWVLVAKPPAP